MTTFINASTSAGLIITPDTSGNIQLQYNGQSAPAFSAYSSVGNTLTSGTWTKVTFDTEEFDTNNNFASSRFTPTVAGYYQINAAADCDAGVGVTTMTRCALGVYKNGVLYKVGGMAWSLGTGTRELEPTVATLVYCNGSTDYVEIYALVTTGSGTPVTGGGSTYTYMNGCLLRGA